MKQILFSVLMVSFFTSLNGQIEGVFTFRDALTGYVVMPDQLTFFNKNDGKIRKEFTSIDFATNDDIKISLPQGQYELVLYKEGYKSIETRFSVEKNSNQNRIFELSPLVRHEKNTLKFLQSKKRKDATVLIGTIVDNLGNPVEGVEIFVSEKEKAVTNAKGYYELTIFYHASHTSGIFKDIVYRKAGHKTIKSQDYFVMPNLSAYQNQILPFGKGEINQKTNDFYIKNGTFGGYPEHQIENHPEIYQKGKISKSIQQSQNCLPSSISVGIRNTTNYATNCDAPEIPFNCGANCLEIVVLDLEEYVKRCIPAEWPGVWISLTNHEEAYAASSVAIRTFAAFRVTNPISSSFDVRNSTCDQKYGGPNPPDFAMEAGNETEGFVLKLNGVFEKAEYSSENNNLSGYQCAGDNPGNITANICGDGNVRNTEFTSQCISDPLGAGWAQFGHGRSMCQFCSMRWATGKAIGFWCNNLLVKQ